MDGQDFADIEAYGEERWLGELADQLRRKTDRAEAVRRVWIPKSDGPKRPLGIPCIADRAVMTAAMAVLAPIFEADLPAEQHAYRANFSAHTAVRSVHSLIHTGHTQMIEGDLAGYFDSLPHAELLKSVARRVSDRHLLHLIKIWLDAPVEEDNGTGGKIRDWGRTRHERKHEQNKRNRRNIRSGHQALARTRTSTTTPVYTHSGRMAQTASVFFAGNGSPITAHPAVNNLPMRRMQSIISA